MARPLASDFLHSMRFHVNAIGAGGKKWLNSDIDASGSVQAGFSAASTPEATVEPVEYKEGQYVYSRKYPGNPSMSDITLSRGVARTDTSFWAWAKVVIEGEGEYRADVEIKHYHRDKVLLGTGPGTGNLPGLNLSATPARTYTCFNAFPTRHKVAADMDATASEISIMELDFAYESFELYEAT